MNINELIKLATEFGLPYITEEGTITIIGSKQNLLFKLERNRILPQNEEKTQCQLAEIY